LSYRPVANPVQHNKAPGKHSASDPTAALRPNDDGAFDGCHRLNGVEGKSDDSKL